MLSVASKQFAPLECPNPTALSLIDWGMCQRGTPSSIQGKLNKWKLYEFSPPRLARRVQEYLPCMRNVARDQTYRASTEIERALVLRAWQHNQAQLRERDTSTGTHPRTGCQGLYSLPPVWETKCGGQDVGICDAKLHLS